MTPDEIAVVRGELEAFAAEVFEPFARNDQRRWGQVYLRGLLTDGQRKSVEPMASRLGEDGNRQALAHFITTSPWDPAHIRAKLAWRMEEVIGPEALVFDDTGFLKDGTASACVSRQYTGTAGKVTNCQVGVSLHLASDHASAAINWRLFLPQTWDPASAKADAGKVARRAAWVLFSPKPPDREGYIAAAESELVWSSKRFGNPALLRELAAESYDRAYYPAGVGRQLGAMILGGSRADALRRLRVPTLVIHGLDDTPIDPGGGKRTADLVPGARPAAGPPSAP
ncbi:transposase [Streptomyces sp. NPDC005181]|uniref:IS701 family transposase n=1 Tax=Streptomyces sp. NPDC005181 TaxID=3156869 RepID=UPI0033A92DBE